MVFHFSPGSWPPDGEHTHGNTMDMFIATYDISHTHGNTGEYLPYDASQFPGYRGFFSRESRDVRARTRLTVYVIAVLAQLSTRPVLW